MILCERGKGRQLIKGIVFSEHTIIMGLSRLGNCGIQCKSLRAIFPSGWGTQGTYISTTPISHQLEVAEGAVGVNPLKFLALNVGRAVSEGSGENPQADMYTLAVKGVLECTRTVSLRESYSEEQKVARRTVQKLTAESSRVGNP